MRAVIHERYGPPEVLRVGDVERPVPEVDQVLVEVHASTVTRGDAMGVRSEDYRFTRVFTGIRRPGGRPSARSSPGGSWRPVRP
jgi:NADPH:quinone reductase-like Zn-dependent oxidoreductase